MCVEVKIEVFMATFGSFFYVGSWDGVDFLMAGLSRGNDHLQW